MPSAYQTLLAEVQKNCLIIESEFLVGKTFLSGIKTVDYQHSILRISLNEIKTVSALLVEF